LAVGAVVVDPSKAGPVKRIFGFYAESGSGVNRIIDGLQHRPVPTPCWPHPHTGLGHP
jgi:hypothetical protein